MPEGVADPGSRICHLDYRYPAGGVRFRSHAATQIGDAMQSSKLVAWVEPRSRHESVAAFVSAATASHRAPAVRQCSSLAEARHWVQREAAALGHVSVEWVSEPLSHC